MDLSHWDLMDEFTMREAACLAGGIEPLVYHDLPPEQRAKADLIYRAISSALSEAELHVRFALTDDGRIDPGETKESIFSVPFFHDVPLPSKQLLREVARCQRSGCKFDLERSCSEELS